MEKHSFGAYGINEPRSVWQQTKINQEPRGQVYKPVVFWIKLANSDVVELDVICVYNFLFSEEKQGYQIKASFILPPDDLSDFYPYLPLIAEGFLQETAKNN